MDDCLARVAIAQATWRILPGWEPPRVAVWPPSVTRFDQLVPST